MGNGVGDARAARDGQELGAEADETARGHNELHAHPAGAVVAHPVHTALASREKLGDRAEVLLRCVDGEVFEGLVNFSIHLLDDHLRLADRELEAFPAHLLDEDGEGQFSTSLHLPGVRATDVHELDRDVTDELAVQAILDHPRSELVTLDLADHRRGIGADGHRDGRVVDRDGRQGPNVVRVGEGLTDRDVFETGNGDDVARACRVGREAIERPRDKELGDAHVMNAAVVLDPRDRLALLDMTVEDPEQREATEERRCIEVGDVRLQGMLVVVGRGRNVLEDRVEQRLEVVVVGQSAVLRLVPAGGAVTTGRVDDRDVEDRVEIEVRVLVGHVARKAEEQVLALGDDLVDAGIRAVRLVDEQDDGKVGFERLTQHETGLRQRAFARVDEQHDAIHHGQAALDLPTEVGVAGGVDHIDGDRAVCGVDARVGDGGVLGQDGDALFALEVVRVHGALFEMRVGSEGIRLAEHGVDKRRLAVVDVRDDGDVAQVITGGNSHRYTSLKKIRLESEREGQRNFTGEFHGRQNHVSGALQRTSLPRRVKCPGYLALTGPQSQIFQSRFGVSGDGATPDTRLSTAVTDGNWYSGTP